VSLESDLVAALDPLAGGRVFADAAPLDTPRPYITYQQVGGEAVNFLGTEIPSQKHARVQVNVWHDTRAGANTLMKQVEDVIRAAPLLGVVEGALIAQYEQVSTARGAVQDFSFWHD
jgi:hypothetical protein